MSASGGGREAARWLVQLHRALLRTYPPAFPRDYAAELEAVFLARYRQAGGGAARARVAREALVGALRHGLAARVSHLGRSRGVLADARQAIRGLSRSPRFSLLLIAVIGAPLGAAVLVLGIVDATLVRELPYDRPDELVFIWGSNPARGQLRDVIAGPNAIDLARRSTGLAQSAAFKQDQIVLRQDGRPRLVQTLLVTPGFTQTLGVKPHLGRALTAADGRAGAEAVVVLSHELWQGAFAADREIVGRRLPAGDGFVTVVGVLPPDFAFPIGSEALVPLDMDWVGARSRTSFDYWMIGRLGAGVTAAQADAELDAIMATIARAEEPWLHDWSLLVEPLEALAARSMRPALLAVTAGVALLVIMALANAGGLIIVRTTERRGQLALRAALGADRSRLVRLMFLEALALAAAATMVALALAALGVRSLPRLLPTAVAVADSAAQVTVRYPQLDGRMVASALILGLLAAVVTALPAMVSIATLDRSRGVLGGRRTSTATRGTRRLQDVLVVTEIAVALVLLAAAGLASTTVYRLLAVDTGLRSQGVLTMYVGDLGSRDAADRVAYYQQVEAAVTRLAVVQAAGFTDYVPLQNEDDFEALRFDEAPEPGPALREEWRRISPGYLAASGIDLVSGRAFESADFAADGASVALVNQAFARKYFADRDPVGETMTVGGGVGETRIVGVVGDVRRRGLRATAPPVFYVPYTRQTRPVMALFVRTSGTPQSALDSLREAIWSVDSTQPIDSVMALDEVVRASAGVPRLTAWIVNALAIAALLLATVGVFGLFGQAVRTRRREFGVRLALGADHGAVRRLVMRRALALVMGGAAIGLFGVATMAGLVETLLFGVEAWDGRLLAAATATIAIGALLATWIPVRRIGRIAPAESLADPAI